jgi:hypothetical protein
MPYQHENSNISVHLMSLCSRMMAAMPSTQQEVYRMYCGQCILLLAVYKSLESVLLTLLGQAMNNSQEHALLGE